MREVEDYQEVLKTRLPVIRLLPEEQPFAVPHLPEVQIDHE